MNVSFSLIFLWAIAANLLGMLPSRDRHRKAAAALIATGLPILGYVTWRDGPLIGLMALAAGMWMLRWPVMMAWRRLRGLWT